MFHVKQLSPKQKNVSRETITKKRMVKKMKVLLKNKVYTIDKKYIGKEFYGLGFGSVCFIIATK